MLMLLCCKNKNNVYTCWAEMNDYIVGLFLSIFAVLHNIAFHN